MSQLRQGLQPELAACKEAVQLLEQKHREVALTNRRLRDELELKQSCLDTAQTVVVALDITRHITTINRAGRDLIGLPEDELVGQCWFERFVPQPEGTEVAFPQFARLVAGDPLPGERLSELPTVDSHGQVRSMSWNSALLIDPAGRIVGALGAGEDVTERKKIEAALSQERFLLRALMQHVPDHVYFKDIDSHFIRLSSSMVQNLRLSDPEQAVGLADFDFFTEEHARQAFADEQEILRSGRNLTTEEKCL